MRIDEAMAELHRIITDREMKEALLLVFANKQDIAGGQHLPVPKDGNTANTDFCSNEPTRGTRAVEVEPAKGQALVRCAELRHDWGRVVRGSSKS